MSTATADPLTFAYHELRRPLGLMVLAAQSVACDVPDGDLRARCETIIRHGERLLRTAGEVMHLAVEGKPVARPALQVDALVDEVARDYRVLGFPVMVEHATGTPDAWAPREPLEVLLCSLLGNAIDHGAEAVTISTQGDRGGSACVRIHNTISAERAHAGLGLGTAICRRAIRSLGGVMEAGITDDGFEVVLRLPGVEAMVAA